VTKSVVTGVSMYTPTHGHTHIYIYIQDVPGGKFNILGGHSICHSKQNIYINMCPIPNGFRDRAI
jgi:hypothetical protein